jgi:hypothetical protein
MGELTADEKQELYAWIDKIPLSRQKRNIARDFSDGVMAAELACHFFPRLVELHNYTSANSISQKLSNWRTLNRKVFAKLEFEVPDQVLQEIVHSQPGVIEYLLSHFKKKVEHHIYQNQKSNHISSQQFSLTNEEIIENSHEIQDVLNSSASHVHPPLPPLVTSSNHTSKIPKPSSYIPRARNSSIDHHHHHNHHTLTFPPSVSNHHSSSHLHTSMISQKKDHQQGTKLPPIKDGLSKKRSGSYTSQHSIVSKLNKSTGLEMAEKDQIIMELQETIQLLSMKVNRLEHLVRIKDYRIHDLERIILSENINKR